MDSHEAPEQQHQEIAVDRVQQLADRPCAGFDDHLEPIEKRRRLQTILLPAVEIDECADLLAGREREQIHPVLEADLFERVEETLGGERPHEPLRVRCAENQIAPVPCRNPIERVELLAERQAVERVGAVGTLIGHRFTEPNIDREGWEETLPRAARRRPGEYTVDVWHEALGQESAG